MRVGQLYFRDRESFCWHFLIIEDVSLAIRFHYKQFSIHCLVFQFVQPINEVVIDHFWFILLKLYFSRQVFEFWFCKFQINCCFILCVDWTLPKSYFVEQLKVLMLLGHFSALHHNLDFLVKVFGFSFWIIRFVDHFHLFYFCIH